MITQIHDNSAVESYLRELSARQAEKTRSLSIENFTKEAPYKVLKIGGLLLALAILFYLLGLGIGNARSFEVVTINENIETRNGFEKFSTDNSAADSQDTLINVDEILQQQEKTIPSSLEKNIPQQGTAVRNYYIFDTIPLTGKKIKELIIGRMFSSPDSPPDLEYCYVEVGGLDGLSKRLDLVELKSGKREETEINSKIAESLQVSVEELKGAQSRCTL